MQEYIDDHTPIERWGESDHARAANEAATARAGGPAPMRR